MYQVMNPNLIVATEIILIVVLCGLIVLAFTMWSARGQAQTSQMSSKPLLSSIIPFAGERELR
jgi:hypothetical protein